MVLVVPEEDSETVLAVAEADGYNPRDIGVVTEKRAIVIRNRGLGSSKDKWLTF